MFNSVTPGAGPASLYPDPAVGAYGDPGDPELPPMRLAARPGDLPPVRAGFGGGGIGEAAPAEPYGLDSIQELAKLPDRRKSVRKSIVHA